MVRRAGLHGPVLRRLVRHGHGFHPLGRPTPEGLRTPKEAMAAAGRDAGDLEMIGGTTAVFPDDHSPADLGAFRREVMRRVDGWCCAETRGSVGFRSRR
ncbi:hypothetical protein ABZY05_23375 [Streptomyces canus]